MVHQLPTGQMCSQCDFFLQRRCLLPTLGQAGGGHDFSSLWSLVEDPSFGGRPHAHRACRFPPFRGRDDAPGGRAVLAGRRTRPPPPMALTVPPPTNHLDSGRPFVFMSGKGASHKPTIMCLVEKGVR